MGCMYEYTNIFFLVVACGKGLLLHGKHLKFTCVCESSWTITAQLVLRNILRGLEYDPQFSTFCSALSLLFKPYVQIGGCSLLCLQFE